MIEPFFTSKPVGEDSGLGLSMAFGFARHSGGYLKIESRIGQGTTVRLYLPKVLSEAPASTPEMVPEHDAALRGLRVFLIEDNEDLRQIFSNQMSSLGCVVHNGQLDDGVVLLQKPFRLIELAQVLKEHA